MIVQLSKGLGLELGFTICLRINLEYFGFNYIISSTDFGFSLAPYTLHKALVRLTTTSFDIDLPEYSAFTSWHSVCITVDNSAHSIRLSYSDYDVGAAVMLTNVSKSMSDLVVGNFTGKVTDVNMWNWPLTTKQQKEFVNACSNNNSLVERIVPNLINWQNLTILALGQTANRTTFGETDLCKYGNVFAFKNNALLLWIYVFYFYPNERPRKVFLT